jgi:mannosyltransferase OCH1-like enzyme
VNPAIPKVFHQIWIGPDPLPDEFKRYGQTWLDHHPGWELRLHTAADLTTRYPIIVEQCREYRHAANIYRYELLLETGGVYIDTDFECLRNIEEELLDARFVAAAQRDNVYAPDAINNAFFACTPEHAVLKRLVDAIPTTYAENQHLRAFGKSHFGPALFTHHVLLGAVRDGALVLRRQLFYPKPHELDQYTCAVHHWASSKGLRGPGILSL